MTPQRATASSAVSIEQALHLKKNICQFSGFIWTESEEKQRTKVKEKLDKCLKDKLLDFCDILDIPVSRAKAKKEEISAKLLEFLESPHVTRDTVLAEEQKGIKRKRTSEGTSGDAESDRESKKWKKSNVSSANKKGHKNPTKITEENEEESGSASSASEDEGGAGGSDHEGNETEDEGDEREHVHKKVSTQRQKGKGPKSKVNVKPTVKKGYANSAKNLRSSSAKSPSKDKRMESGESSKSSSMQQRKRGSKASTNQETEPTNKGSDKVSKRTSSSRASSRAGKNDSGLHDASKLKGGNGKSKKDGSLTETKDKKRGLDWAVLMLDLEFLVVDKTGWNAETVTSSVVSAGGKGSSSRKPEPTREEMSSAVTDILKEVDFNTATLADVVRQLETQFGVDLMHRRAEIKNIIEEVVLNMTDDEEDRSFELKSIGAATARSREADSDQVRYWFNGLGRGVPSHGVPKAATLETLTSPFNDFETVKSLFEAHKDEIAAVILEPVVGNAGFIRPKAEFLTALRRITKENGALLIFDEVMTGFRLSYGTLRCLQEPGCYDYLDKITGDLINGI
ncbi:hypothetical protein Taro_013092, partial [Colocasia esculenta]|nr:hypothetical protein [Colocasia esculenta]